MMLIRTDDTKREPSTCSAWVPSFLLSDARLLHPTFNERGAELPH